MSIARKVPDREGELLYVRRSADAGPFAELSMVRLLVAVPTDGGGTVPAGSTGAVVGIWDDGKAYEVEFAEPVGALATVEAAHLCAA